MVGLGGVGKSWFCASSTPDPGFSGCKTAREIKEALKIMSLPAWDSNTNISITQAHHRHLSSVLPPTNSLEK